MSTGIAKADSGGHAGTARSLSLSPNGRSGRTPTLSLVFSKETSHPRIPFPVRSDRAGLPDPLAGLAYGLLRRENYYGDRVLSLSLPPSFSDATRRRSGRPYIDLPTGVCARTTADSRPGSAPGPACAATGKSCQGTRHSGVTECPEVSGHNQV